MPLPGPFASTTNLHVYLRNSGIFKSDSNITPGTAEVSVFVYSTGLTNIGTSSNGSSYRWRHVGGAPTDNGNFEVMLTTVSGSSPNVGSSVGQWLSLSGSNNRTWTLRRTTSVGTSSGTWLIQLRRTSDNAVIASATQYVEAIIEDDGGGGQNTMTL